MNHCQHLQLSLFVGKHLGRDFKWGKTDCLTLALEWINEITGEDQIQSYWEGLGVVPPPVHTTKKEAEDYCEEFGNIFMDILTSVRAEKIKEGFQTSGDFVVVGDKDFGSRIHICNGPTVLAATERHGVVLYPVSMLDSFEVYRCQQ